MSKSYFRGHSIELRGSEYVFSDTGDVVRDTWESRPCRYCKRFNTVEDHDACLGTLPGVMNACCGHGCVDEAYVQFLDKTVVNGSAAVEVQEILKMQRWVKCEEIK